MIKLYLPPFLPFPFHWLIFLCFYKRMRLVGQCQRGNQCPQIADVWHICELLFVVVTMERGLGVCIDPELNDQPECFLPMQAFVPSAGEGEEMVHNAMRK